jgi:hypothetical protein
LIAMTISGNPLAFGPAPLGPGSCFTLFYSTPAPPPVVVGPLPAPFIPECAPVFAPAVAGILPVTGTIFDGCGFLAPAPISFPTDAGGGRFVFTAAYPPFAPPTVAFQAAGISPAGTIWITNSVTLFAGPNAAEVPVPFPVVCGAFPPLDEGQSLGNPTPPGFTFYGFPAPFVDLDTNGFADFVPGVGAAVVGGCDFTGEVGDLGCAVATADARPKISVNHIDYDFGVVPAAPFLPIITMEFRPPGPFWPDAFIYRWKNAPAFGAAPGIAGLSTAALALEVQGGACGCIPAVVPSRIVVVRSWLIGVEQVGIGPGLAPAGYGGPPPAVPTCSLGAAGLAFMGTLIPFPPFVGVPGGAIHMDLAASSAAVLNSAIVFTPIPGPPPVPYMLSVY